MPDDIPRKPDNGYKNKGWVSWYDFLGKKKSSYFNYKKAKAYAKENNIKSAGHYNKLKRSKS